MSETKTIGSISIITDTETSYEHIGDVDGGFDSIQLKEHIKKYGTTGLLEKMAWMNFQIWETYRELNAEKDKGQNKVVVSG